MKKQRKANRQAYSRRKGGYAGQRWYKVKGQPGAPPGAMVLAGKEHRAALAHDVERCLWVVAVVNNKGEHCGSYASPRRWRARQGAEEVVELKDRTVESALDQLSRALDDMRSLLRDTKSRMGGVAAEIDRRASLDMDALVAAEEVGPQLEQDVLGFKDTP